MSILEVKNVSKSFLDYSNEWKRILNWFGFNFEPKDEHIILKNINFSISAGEAIGIVGQNGAGKSTLLKIITQTLKPSKGTIIVNGRISAILELGMGFHPDLTGRENVYHSSGLMGFTRSQIDAVIDEIEDFAEIGDYFEQPVRTYSSGMGMRVAFGVATAYRPDILIIDEALSVGDSYFQHKSFNRIKKFQNEGTTLLLVSHDKNAIQAICNRAILLESGSVIKDGNPEEVMDFYNAIIAQKENSKVEQKSSENGKIETISGTGEANIVEVKLLDDNNQEVEYISVGDSVKIKVKVYINQDISELVLGYMIKDRLGQSIFGTNTHFLKQPIKDLKKDTEIEYIFNFDANIGVGSYSITVAIHSGESHITDNYEWRDNALIFQVANPNKNEFIGTSWIAPTLEYKINS
ncbi:ABC transporter [hydrothermal vent metagenome]|uniref:ABC transporter n=1 Tax=hydrothermal vent metagenome TaxID=652676 RepID=A0A1W1BNL1_9ZZZZ